jgi:hypothetical protein
MMILKRACLPVAVFSALIACTSSTAPPSAERVEKRLVPAVSEHWPGVKAKVVGIQADPQGNAATADLQFSKDGQAWGNGKAQLVHYTDGRWVITGFHITNGPSVTQSVLTVK